MESEVVGKLLKAVSNGDFQNVKYVLSCNKVDVNFRVKDFCGETTFLHFASSAEIVKELLIHGADINAQDYNGRTPLLYAVMCRRRHSVVKELLKNGADPNLRNHNGITALTPAITNGILETITILLDYGAEINIPTISPLLRYPTPLAKAIIADETIAKLLIKDSMLKHSECDYRKIINLNLYSECQNYNVLSKFMDDCISEIKKMKTQKVNKNLSLHDFVIRKIERIKYVFEICELSDDSLLIIYPIYHDVILGKKKMFYERVSLLDNLRMLSMYRNLKANHQINAVHKVILNLDCLYRIAEYLCNDDLFNIVAAFKINCK